MSGTPWWGPRSKRPFVREGTKGLLRGATLVPSTGTRRLGPGPCRDPQPGPRNWALISRYRGRDPARLLGTSSALQPSLRLSSRASRAHSAPHIGPSSHRSRLSGPSTVRTRPAHRRDDGVWSLSFLQRTRISCRNRAVLREFFLPDGGTRAPARGGPDAQGRSSPSAG